MKKDYYQLKLSCLVLLFLNRKIINRNSLTLGLRESFS